MKNNIFVILTALIALAFMSCEKMNDLHDPYLENGEIDYVGRVDSVKVYSGNGRIKFEYWITDPRATKLHIKWNEAEEMVKIIEIPAHDAAEMQEYILGEDVTLPEKSYTFTFVSESDLGVTSVNFEALGNVYGTVYAEGLTKRRITGLNYENEVLKINFGAPTNENNIGVQINYFNSANEAISVVFNNEALANAIEVADIDVTKGAKYQTLYLPEENAIDTFLTVPVAIEITQSKNIAFGANVTVSGQLKDAYGGTNAVDGNVSSSTSRWLNANQVGDHWLAVDFGQEYPVDKLKLFINEPNKAPEYKLQVDVNGEWQDIANVTGDLAAVYEQTLSPAVNTSKVRLFFTTAATSTYLRLFEIEVYSTIKY